MQTHDLIHLLMFHCRRLMQHVETWHLMAGRLQTSKHPKFLVWLRVLSEVQTKKFLSPRIASVTVEAGIQAWSLQFSNSTTGQEGWKSLRAICLGTSRWWRSNFSSAVWIPGGLNETTFLLSAQSVIFGNASVTTELLSTSTSLLDKQPLETAMSVFVQPTDGTWHCTSHWLQAASKPVCSCPMNFGSDWREAKISAAPSCLRSQKKNSKKRKLRKEANSCRKKNCTWTQCKLKTK